MLAVLSVAAAVPALASVAEDDETEAEGAETRPTAGQQQVTEYVYVKGSTVPNSNTIATKLPLPIRLTPANVGAVSAALIREQDAVVLGDALTNVSGLNVQSNAGVHDFFLIRGFDSLNGGLVLTDGAAEPEATFHHLYNVEGVEVLKGPGGFLYGSNPLAGVVNLVRKQPVPAPLLDVAASLGSFDTAEGRFDWNLPGASRAPDFRVNGFWRESDNYRDGKPSRHFAVNPGAAWRIGDDATLNVGLEYVEAEFSPDSGIPVVNEEIADVPRRRSYQSPFDFSEQQLYRFQVDFETRLHDRLKLRNKTYYRDLDWQSNGTLFNGVFPNLQNGRPEVSRTLTLLDDRQRFAGNQIELVLEADGGALDHHLLVGVETARLTDEYSLRAALLPSIDLFDPRETASGPLFPFPAAPAGQAPSGNSRTLIVAPYAVDQMKLRDDLQLLLGARADYIDFEDDLNGNARDDTRLSPMAGLVWSPTASLSAYVNASTSFAPPSPRVLGDPRPEESAQAEIGLRRRFLDGRLTGVLAAYQLERENIAIPDDNGVTQQTGDQRSRGVELELATEPFAGFRAFLSYAYTDAELTEFAERLIVGFDPQTFLPIFATLDRSGNDPAFAPEHMANVWVSRTFANRLGVAGGGRYFSEQFIAEDNAFRIDGAIVLDAAVSYGLGDWVLRLHLKNLTDEEYETRGFGSTSVIPAPGFSASVGFEYRR